MAHDVCGDDPTREDLQKIEQEQERSILMDLAQNSEDESVIELVDQLVMVTKLVHDEELAEQKKWQNHPYIMSAVSIMVSGNYHPSRTIQVGATGTVTGSGFMTLAQPQQQSPSLTNTIKGIFGL